MRTRDHHIDVENSLFILWFFVVFLCFLLFVLGFSVPVQVIAWEDSSLK